MELSICILDPCCTDWSGRLLRRDTEIETDFGRTTKGTEEWELYEIGYSVVIFGLLVLLSVMMKWMQSTKRLYIAIQHT